MKDKKDKITYRDLSWPLKIAVVTAWADLTLMLFLFIQGFVIGFLGAA